MSTDYSALENMYQEVILEESRAPHGKVDEVTDEHASHQFNPTCGDDIKLTYRSTDNSAESGGSKVTDKMIDKIEYQAEGCSISVSSASIMAKLVEGKTVQEAEELIALFKKLMNSRGEGLDAEEMDRLGDASVFVGTSKFPARIKCALLPWAALEGVLD